MSVFQEPRSVLTRYLLRNGSYPCTVTVNTPFGPKAITLYSVDDLLTVCEIFARNIYRVDRRPKIVVDFGSNIGISIAYFLSRSEGSFVYGFEPVPLNAERLRRNLAGWEARYEIAEQAIATSEGEIDFATESTGRYGGIGRHATLLSTGFSDVHQFRAQCRSANEVIAQVLENHGRIDVIKIDIEGMEQAVLSELSVEHLPKIGTIYAEVDAAIPRGLLQTTHVMSLQGATAKFVNRASGDPYGAAARSSGATASEPRRGGFEHVTQASTRH